MEDFARCLEQLRVIEHPLIAIGECVNVELPDIIEFQDLGWQKVLTSVALKQGESRGRYAMDFFIFRRNFYAEVPPFSIGRLWFDNWLVWKARNRGAFVLDVTPAVLAIHQNHDYSHAGGKKTVSSLPSVEVMRNLGFAGGYWHLHSMHEATHRVTRCGIEPYWPGIFKLRFYLVRPWRLFWYFLLDLTRPVRQALGLRRSSP